MPFAVQGTAWVWTLHGWVRQALQHLCLLAPRAQCLGYVLCIRRDDVPCKIWTAAVASHLLFQLLRQPWAACVSFLPHQGKPLV